MNAPAQILSLDQAITLATDNANCWRGWMVNQFARGERMIAEALQRLEPGAKIPTVLKQRVERLRPSVDPNANEALDQFLSLTLHRNTLAHGDGLLTVDRKGRWMLRLTCYGRDGPADSAISELEGEALRDSLRSATNALQAALKR